MHQVRDNDGCVAAPTSNGVSVPSGSSCASRAFQPIFRAINSSFHSRNKRLHFRQPCRYIFPVQHFLHHLYRHDLRDLLSPGTSHKYYGWIRRLRTIIIGLTLRFPSTGIILGPHAASRASRITCSIRDNSLL